MYNAKIKDFRRCAQERTGQRHCSDMRVCIKRYCICQMDLSFTIGFSLWEGGWAGRKGKNILQKWTQIVLNIVNLKLKQTHDHNTYQLRVAILICFWFYNIISNGNSLYKFAKFRVFLLLFFFYQKKLYSCIL